VEQLLDDERVLLVLDEQPVQEHQEQVDPAADQQQRLALVQRRLDPLRVGERDLERLEDRELLGPREVDDQQRQHAPDHHDREEQPPDQEQAAVALFERLQHVRVDDGVVDRADDLEHHQPQDHDQRFDHPGPLSPPRRAASVYEG
jgi:hypothetical protein